MYAGKKVAERGVPVILPPGGHAIYLDVNKMFKERKWNEFAGCGLVAYMITKYAIRGCELGYQAWELDKYVDKYNKMPERLPPNFVRFAFPANVFHKEHLVYFINSLDEANRNKDKIPSV
jgi:tryptophanase